MLVIGIQQRLWGLGLRIWNSGRKLRVRGLKCTAWLSYRHTGDVGYAVLEELDGISQQDGCPLQVSCK